MNLTGTQRTTSITITVCDLPILGFQFHLGGTTHQQIKFLIRLFVPVNLTQRVILISLNIHNNFIEKKNEVTNSINKENKSKSSRVHTSMQHKE
jgi:hypothetical protein